MNDALALLQALAALALVFGLVWYGRRALSRGGLLGRRSERMLVEERIALDLRNALLIVRIEERRLLLSVSPEGPARLLLELGRASGSGAQGTLASEAGSSATPVATSGIV